MSNALTVLNQDNTIQTQEPQGGLGIDFSSPLFKLSPAIVNICQPNSQAEGSVPGKLRISDTGDLYDNMFVAFLLMPTEERQWYIGEKGQLNRSPENLMCFCRNVVRNNERRELQGPDEKAKSPQSMRCASCSKADWNPWREGTSMFPAKSKELLPECDNYYRALMIDTKFKMPLSMYFRSKAKGPFEQGMQVLARKFAMLKSEGKNPNIFDIGFTLSTEKIVTGKAISYVPKFTNFREITPEERAEFGNIYLQYANRNTQADDESGDTVDQTNAAIDNAVTGVDDEIAI
jgi:hypothetical protein